MEVYQTKVKIIPGTIFKTVEKIARRILKDVTKKTKRTPFIRSAYFKKEKVFLTIFWSHLHQKNDKERLRRLKYFECAIDLIKNSRHSPIISTSSSNKNEKLYRFIGKIESGDIFYIQIKENIKTKRKDLISIFPQK